MCLDHPPLPPPTAGVEFKLPSGPIVQVLLEGQHFRLSVEVHCLEPDKGPMFHFVHSRQEGVQVGCRTSVHFEDPLKSVQRIPVDGTAVAPSVLGGKVKRRSDEHGLQHHRKFKKPLSELLVRITRPCLPRATRSRHFGQELETLFIRL
jgi:hypothetical protein